MVCLKLYKWPRKYSVLLLLFFTDNTDLTWYLQSGRGADYLLPMLKATISILRQHPSWSITHIFREENTIADFLANKARKDFWGWSLTDAIPRIPLELLSTISHLFASALGVC